MELLKPCLIDKALSKNAMSLLANLIKSKCEIRGDAFIQSLDKNFKQAI